MTDYRVLGSLSFHEMFLVGFLEMPVMAPRPSAPSLMAVWVRVPALYQESPDPPSSGVRGRPGLPARDLLVLHVQSQRPCGNSRSASGTSPTKLAQDWGRNSLDPGKGCRPGQRSPQWQPLPARALALPSGEEGLWARRQQDGEGTPARGEPHLLPIIRETPRGDPRRVRP